MLQSNHPNFKLDLPTNVADEDDLDSLLNSETDITKDTDDTSG